ncbi:MAG: FkbM family methyltransferase [Methanoregula sp.]
MIGKIFSTFEFFRAFLTIKNIQISKEIVKYGICSNVIKYNIKTKEICFCELGINIPREKSGFLIKGYNYAILLKDSAKAIFSTTEDGELLIHIDALNFFVQSEEDFYILKEVFLDGIYNIIDSKKNLIIDIGMNVGISSIYLSSKGYKKIFSFEPFKQTYEQALKNLKLNPQFTKNIIPNNFGLGEKNEILSVDFCYEYKGSMSLIGIPKRIQMNGIKGNRETVIIKEVNEILIPIFKNHEGFDFILKIDCEGSEYGILNSLNEGNALQKIKSIMVEWHSKGPEPLVEILNNAGFTIFSFSPLCKSIGMIYAVNSNIQGDVNWNG